MKQTQNFILKVFKQENIVLYCIVSVRNETKY